jgi:hypothetical protein
MGDSSRSERLRQLERDVRDELEQREDLLGYEIKEHEVQGVLVTVAGEDGTQLYRVTLERRPDGIDGLRWSYLGASTRE